MSKGQHSFTEALNLFFDKLFAFAKGQSCKMAFEYFERQLRNIVDYVAQAFAEIDYKQRDFFFGWELKDYLKNSVGGRLAGLNPSSEEIDAFIRYAVSIAGLDLEEQDSALSVKIKH